MIKVVIDCNVVIAGAGWQNEPHLCLVAVARRRIRAFATEDMFAEYRLTAKKLEARKVFPKSPWPVLDWFMSSARMVNGVPTGHQRSRDASDDIYLSCALGAGATYIVTRDPDLLSLEKPFGIDIITPRALLNRLADRF